MKTAALAFLFALLIFSDAFSQGTIRGKITDENGEPLIGASVVLKSDYSVGAMTDYDGNYSLKISQASPQSVVVSYIGYEQIEAEVNPKNGEVLMKNFQMASSSKSLNEVTIVAKQEKERDYYMESIKKKSATTIDYISSESMKRVGDNNIATAIA